MYLQSTPHFIYFVETTVSKRPIYLRHLGTSVEPLIREQTTYCFNRDNNLNCKVKNAENLRSIIIFNVFFFF